MKRLFSSTNSSPGIFPTAYWENSGNKSTFIDKNRAIFKLFDGILGPEKNLGPTSNQNSLADILIINESRKCSEFQFDEDFTVSKDQTLNLDSFLFFS